VHISLTCFFTLLHDNLILQEVRQTAPLAAASGVDISGAVGLAQHQQLFSWATK
jgi:hypothetical protein